MRGNKKQTHYTLQEAKSINHGRQHEHGRMENFCKRPLAKHRDLCAVRSFFSACICLQLSTLLPMFTKTWHTRGHGENVRVISWLRPRENILPQIHNRQRYINPQINTCQLVNHICEMGKKYICAHEQLYVNVRFLPPFGLCSLAVLTVAGTFMAQSLESSILIKHPLPFEGGVNMELG